MIRGSFKNENNINRMFNQAIYGNDKELKRFLEKIKIKYKSEPLENKKHHVFRIDGQHKDGADTKNPLTSKVCLCNVSLYPEQILFILFGYSDFRNYRCKDVEYITKHYLDGIDVNDFTFYDIDDNIVHPEKSYTVDNASTTTTSENVVDNAASTTTTSEKIVDTTTFKVGDYFIEPNGLRRGLVTKLFNSKSFCYNYNPYKNEYGKILYDGFIKVEDFNKIKKVNRLECLMKQAHTPNDVFRKKWKFSCKMNNIAVLFNNYDTIKSNDVAVYHFLENEENNILTELNDYVIFENIDGMLHSTHIDISKTFIYKNYIKFFDVNYTRYAAEKSDVEVVSNVTDSSSECIDSSEYSDNATEYIGNDFEDTIRHYKNDSPTEPTKPVAIEVEAVVPDKKIQFRYADIPDMQAIVKMVTAKIPIEWISNKLNIPLERINMIVETFSKFEFS